MTGWVKIHRALSDHDMWLAEPFTYGQAWVDLVMNANHAPGSFMVKRQRVSLERGQIGWSEITMAERWKWSRGKVRRFLKRLSNDGMIEQQAGHLTSVITICNYDSYQDKPKEDGTSNGTSGSTALGTPNEHLTVHEAVHKQECKEELELKNGKKKTSRAKALDFSAWPQMPSEQVLDDYMSMRKRNKFSASQTVVNRIGIEIRKLLQEGVNPDDALGLADMKGWQGFKSQWVINEIKGNSNGSHQQAPGQPGQIDHDDTTWGDEFLSQPADHSTGQQDLRQIESDLPRLEASDPHYRR